MRDVAVIGVGMTKFGKWLDKSLKDLSREALDQALKHAGIDKKAIQIACVGNAVAGFMTGQECIRGQTVLRPYGIDGIPVFNMESACASSSSAFHAAWLAVVSGQYDVALALGVEKLYDADKAKSFRALSAAVDVEDVPKEFLGEGASSKRSMFMDFYAHLTREHMKKYGTTREQLAMVSVKNHHNGCLNPHAQYQTECTVEEVLNSPMIADPLTLLMCSPLGDGAAAAILASADFARKVCSKPIWVAASVLKSGIERAPDEPDLVEISAKKAYEVAGIGSEDLDVIEVHDAAVPAEIMAYEELGLCAHGDGGKLIQEGVTTLTGRYPVNPSGGLSAKGHPVGATGVAQIVEIVWHLRGEAGARQVKGAKVGLTENGGGIIKKEMASLSIHIFKN